MEYKRICRSDDGKLLLEVPPELQGIELEVTLRPAGATTAPSSLSESLAGLTRGLLWMSESDYPFEVVDAGEVPAAVSLADHLVRHFALKPPVETRDPAFFFRNALRDQPWHGEAEKETTRRFRELWAFLQANLSHLTVLCSGDTEKTVYIAGIGTDGKCVCLQTKVVET